MAEFRQALEDAAANGESDRIVLAKGTYNVTSDGLGTLTFDDNEAFNLTIEAQKGLTSKDVILDGNNSTQVFNFDNKKSSTLILKNISVVDGNTTKHGAVYTNHNIEIKDCNISNNKASLAGGFFSAGTTKVANSTISNNSDGGGGFRDGQGGGGFYSNGVTTVTESTISNNSSSRYYSYGGGFYSNGATTVTKSTISNNSSSGYYSYGGGFYSNGATTVTKSTISNNNSGAVYSYGGGFYSNGATTVTKSTISNNNSGDLYSYGGGFYANGGAYNSDVVTTVTESTISNNSSRSHDYHHYSSGGGFYVNHGTTTVNSSNISNNSANSGGGFSSEATTTVTNSIFTENNASNGAIFASLDYFPQSSYLSNNIFIKNKGSIISKGIFINNIFDSNNADITLSGDSKIYNNYIDYSKIEDNAYNVIKKHNLQPASVGDVYLNNDNETLDSSSPVIDKGLNPSSATYKKIIDNDGIYNQLLELLKTDKVGNKRVHNGTIDMGAVEYGSSK